MSTALNIIQDKYEEFAHVAAPLLHITSESEYEQAQQLVEALLEQAGDDSSFSKRTDRVNQPRYYGL